MLERARRYAPHLVAVGYLLLALPLLPKHGVTYDAPALYYAGDRTLFFLTHPRVPEALNFASRPEPPGFHSFFSRDDEWDDPMRYPVLPGLVAAAVSAVVHDALGLLDPAAAHHLGLVLLQALALGLFAHYAIRIPRLPGRSLRRGRADALPLGVRSRVQQPEGLALRDVLRPRGPRRGGRARQWPRPGRPRRGAVRGDLARSEAERCLRARHARALAANHLVRADPPVLGGREVPADGGPPRGSLHRRGGLPRLLAVDSGTRRPRAWSSG